MTRPLTVVLLVTMGLTAAAVVRKETLKSTGGVPAHVAGLFELPFNFQQLASGEYYVFDRRAHAVYRLDKTLHSAEKIVEIGPEQGRLFGPTAFDSEPEGSFVVADAPAGRERIQIFNRQGQRVGGFELPNRWAPRLTLGPLVLNGVASLQYTGRSIIVSYPDIGALVTEYGLAGTPVRTFGHLRPTGHEGDRDIHIALNAGLPLVNPKGGFYYVFLAGTPVFRKYDRFGQLVFERHIEGVEIDPIVLNLPSSWPRRNFERRGEYPLVLPTIRTAAVDPAGNLWIAFVTPAIYVYDGNGDKIRTIELRAAGLVSPSSLHFPTRERLLVTPGCYEFPVR